LGWLNNITAKLTSRSDAYYKGLINITLCMMTVHYKNALGNGSFTKQCLYHIFMTPILMGVKATSPAQVNNGSLPNSVFHCA